jgi:hypothetical protein
MDRRSDYHSGDVRRGRGYVCCIDCRSRSRRTVELALARFRQPKLSELCSLDRSNHSFHAYAVSIEPMKSRAKVRPSGCVGEKAMIHRTNKLTPKLRKAPQPPLSHAGAIPDSDRAKRPPLSEPAATGQELIPGDRVEGLGNFGKPTGEFGTVKQANEDDAVVKWDDDGRVRVHQPSLKKA